MTFINEGKFFGNIQKQQFNVRDCRARYLEEKNDLFKTGDIENREKIFFDSIEFLTGEKPVSKSDVILDEPFIGKKGELEEIKDDKTPVIEQNFNDEYDNLEQEGVDKKANVQELKAKHADLENQQTQLNTKLKAEQKKLTSLEAQQENIERQQESVQKQMKRLENILQKRNSKSLQARYEQLADKSDALAAKLGNIVDSINNQADKIADLKTQLNAVNQNIETVKGDIETAKLEQTKNETSKNALKAMGFLSNIISSTISQMGMLSSLLALNFMSDMANNVVVGAKNYINQQAAVSMLNYQDQQRVQQEGLDLTEKLPDGRNRFEIIMNQYGRAYLSENHAGYRGMGEIANKNGNLYEGYEYISLNGDGTINHQGYRSSTVVNDFSQLRGNKYNNYKLRNAAYVSGASKREMQMDFAFSTPFEKAFKLGSLAARGAEQNAPKNYYNNDFGLMTFKRGF